jgi:hypothetical protein
MKWTCTADPYTKDGPLANDTLAYTYHEPDRATTRTLTASV